jgi:hypothetical protein
MYTCRFCLHIHTPPLESHTSNMMADYCHIWCGGVDTCHKLEQLFCEGMMSSCCSYYRIGDTGASARERCLYVKPANEVIPSMRPWVWIWPTYNRAAVSRTGM